MSDSANFYDRVYAATSAVPPGRVTTYGAIARQLTGGTMAARGVGWALHALEGAAALRVPWWRVINSQGRVSTRCHSHPALEQRARLEDEGVVFDEQGRVDLGCFGWYDAGV